jgi:hypothetical protein
VDVLQLILVHQITLGYKHHISVDWIGPNVVANRLSLHLHHTRTLSRYPRDVDRGWMAATLAAVVDAKEILKPGGIRAVSGLI